MSDEQSTKPAASTDPQGRLDALVTRPYMTLIGPGIRRRVHVCGETENAVITSFGTFHKPDLSWIVDAKWRIEAV